MNIVKLQDDLKGVPDQSLIGYVQNPSGQVPSYLALSELQRRKKMREQAGGQGQGAQPSVAEQLVAEAQPQGIAGIPVTNVGNEEAYAAGGIIAFEDGGDVQGYASKGEVEKSFDPNESLYEQYLKPWYLRRQEALKKYAVPVPRAAQKLQAETGVGSLVPAMAPPTNITGMLSPELPATRDTTLPRAPVAEAQPPVERPPTPTPAPAPIRQPAGIEKLMFPVMPDRSAEFEITPEVDARAAMDKYKGLVGENPFQAKAAEKLAGMEQANELYKQQYPWMALAEAGFGMAAGKSPFALSNIAEGGTKGMAALVKGRETVRETEDKIFNAQAKVAEAQRAEDIAAAKYGVDSEEAAKAARRTDKAKLLDYQATREFRNASGQMEAQKANISNELERQKMADEKDYRAKSLKVQREIGNKTPAEIQLIERYAASRNIPFDQAFEEIQQGKNEPKSDTAIAKVLIAGDSTLIDNPDRLTAAIQNYKSALSGYSTAKGDALVDKYKTR